MGADQNQTKETTAVSSGIETNVRPFEHFKEHYERLGRLRTAHVTTPDTQIWQAKDKITEEEVSIKVMKKTPRNKLSFLKEVAILKECNGHPNLCHVRNVYEDSKFYYIVTDSIDHPNILQAMESLKDKEGKTAGPEQIAVVVSTVLSGLLYLHDPNRSSKQSKKKIVHGKLHPKNILVPDEDNLGNLMIADFSNGKMALGVDRSISASTSEEEDGSSDDERKDKATTKKKGKCPFQPPEYSKTGPTEKADMWALGVLTYLLLTGKYPFSKPSEMTKPIQNWHGIEDPLCQEFIQGLLQRNPQNRPKAKDITNKKAWFNATAEFKLYPADLGEVMYRLSTLNKEHAFQVAVRSYLATTVMQKRERAKFDQVFRVADRNNDGVLTRREFEKALLKADIDFLEKSTIDGYFDILDVNKDGLISYTEFMAFAEAKELLYEKNRLKAAFDAFDFSGTGYITADDILNFSKSAGGSAAFRGDTVLTDRTIQKMIDRADKDGDGKITFEEFADMMRGTDTAATWTDEDEREHNRSFDETKTPVGAEELLKSIRGGKMEGIGGNTAKEFADMMRGSTKADKDERAKKK